jgi:hypothetical protein
MEKTKEQILLAKLYECQDMMEDLLEKGKDDNHYFLMELLIRRLESFLQDENELL